MKLESVGEIVASRKLTLVHEGAEPVEIVVLMGKPVTLPEDPDGYYCPYQIKGFGLEKVRAISGIDAFQAIQLAQNLIGVELEIIEKDSGGQLFWEGGKKGDLGFPVPDWTNK